jgi:hypothetical protein
MGGMEKITATVDHIAVLTQEIINSEDDTQEVAEIMKEKEIIEEMPEIVDHFQETLAIEGNMSIEEENQDDNAEAQINKSEDEAVLTHDIKFKITTHTLEQAMSKKTSMTLLFKIQMQKKSRKYLHIHLPFKI